MAQGTHADSRSGLVKVTRLVLQCIIAVDSWLRPDSEITYIEEKHKEGGRDREEGARIVSRDTVGDGRHSMFTDAITQVMTVRTLINPGFPLRVLAERSAETGARTSYEPLATSRRCHPHARILALTSSTLIQSRGPSQVTWLLSYIKTRLSSCKLPAGEMASSATPSRADDVEADPIEAQFSSSSPRGVSYMYQ